MLRDISGADVSAFSGELTGEELRRYWLRGFVSNNLDLTNTFSKHPKILVTALNGPVIGLSAALVAFSDFIYAAPHAFLLTPFSSLGLLAEGGSSRAFVERLGISKANEALLMSKRIDSQELLRAGFVNKIFDVKEGQSDIFLELVIKEMEERLGDHLNNESLIRIKALIRRPEREIIERQNALEVFGGLERFIEGIPQEEFRRIRSGEKRHKL
ncbi:ClpP/crotonase [Xylona heveae TC161]|uniref:ClpP/crotonase n=1 Tax=Xylona heveae (strain CBS 132557 / TC161) TaxID=1328760 RepID=A0A165FTG4_XYLHT|nr:ClpP/crotonase [Xylona heveae TC161]KZF21356.1 ClpP/crotonase [Xylona heveae TC161]